MDVIYDTTVEWFCKDCTAEGKAGSQEGAERQAERHKCTVDTKE